MKSYFEHWHISAQVFTYPQSSDDVYYPPAVRDFIQRTMLFCRHGANFIALTAPSGHGKSGLAKFLHDTLPTKSHDVLITAPMAAEQSSGWFMPRLAQFFGYKAQAPFADPKTRADVLKRLDDLIEERKQLVVVIDAAEKLTAPAAFEEIQALLGLQAIAETCLSFIVIGAESLQGVLQASPLAARAKIIYEMKPMTSTETEDYIKNQLRVAGIDENAFKKPVYKAIHEQSNGIYGRINALAENCLMEAQARGKRLVDSEVFAAAAELVNASLKSQGKAKSEDAKESSIKLNQLFKDEAS